MANTLDTPKDELILQSQQKMEQFLSLPQWSTREKLALSCRILFDAGHDSGLAGQITARAGEPGTYYTQQLGLGFDEITASNLLLVDEDLNRQWLNERIDAGEHFAADVTHELKNPIASVRSAVEGLGRVQSDEQRAQLLAA